ncbi:MAG: adenosylhomocysteinase [Chloroflexi bacterium]|nr:MAG: adenosylhomocysteinase [Chloroflexota bacterium]
MVTPAIDYDVKDLALANDGNNRIEWAAREMPVIRLIRERFAKERPLEGLRISACLHVTTETANLMLALRDGGAEVALCASNPLSTQDDAAAALVAMHGIRVYAIRGEDDATYYKHIHAALEHKPQITMDDGADLVATLHKERRELLEHVVAGTEETTTGVIRLRAMAKDGALTYPIIAINEADTKHFFDNRYGTGQSTDVNVLDRRHFDVMKDGAIIANSGHFNVEINIKALEAMSESKRNVRRNVDEHGLMDGRKLFLLGEGRLINLAAAEGHPASVMDMSFANQALAVHYIATRDERLPVDVYDVPREIDSEVARLKLASMGITIDELTEEQEKYLSSWEEGT